MPKEGEVCHLYNDIWVNGELAPKEADDNYRARKAKAEEEKK
jgi:hypothetical protein